MPRPKTPATMWTAGTPAARSPFWPSLVCGHHIYPQNIPTRGIRDITVADVQAAGKLNCVIKLIAWMKLLPGGEVAAGVEPCLVPSLQPAGRRGLIVFNAVKVRGDMLGDVVFYGKGAGKTAHRQRGGGRRGGRPQRGARVHDTLFWQPAAPAEGDAHRTRAPAAYYVRVEGAAPGGGAGHLRGRPAGGGAV